MRKYYFAGVMFLLGSASFAATLIDLPKPRLQSEYSLEQSILNRRSVREFTSDELSMQQLSQILWAAQGITEPEFMFRSTPSAGALYPLQLYVAKRDGFYRYVPEGHKLLEVSVEDVRPSLVRASLGQDAIREAPVSLVIAANFRITQAKFGPRAFRYVCMEAGHVAENIQLQAAAIGLSSIPIGSFWDDVLKKNLNLPDNQDPLYIVPIGYQDKNEQ